MTRRHFVALAKALGEAYRNPANDRATLDRVVAVLLPVFRWANSGFNGDRFMEEVRKNSR